MNLTPTFCTKSYNFANSYQNYFRAYFQCSRGYEFRKDGSTQIKFSNTKMHWWKGLLLCLSLDSLILVMSQAFSFLVAYSSLSTFLNSSFFDPFCLHGEETYVKLTHLLANTDLDKPMPNEWYENRLDTSCCYGEHGCLPHNRPGFNFLLNVDITNFRDV